MPQDPFGELPDELKRLFAAGLSGSGGVPFGFTNTPHAAAQTPVDWVLAKQVALNLLTADTTPVLDTSAHLAREALVIAEQWLNDTELPALTGADTVIVATPNVWVDQAIVTLAPYIEPIAKATTAALTALTTDALDGLQLDGIDQDAFSQIPGFEQMPPEFAAMLQQFLNQDPAQFLAPAARALAGLQAGQVLGELATRLLYQHEFTLPTASHTDAVILPGNISDSFAGYGLDMRDVTVTIALEEAAFRRVFHAIGWLNQHLVGLFEQFAAGISFDKDLLEQLSRDFIGEFDVSDEDSLKAAMERAARFTLPPNEKQQQVLNQLHAVLGVVGAWARREARSVAEQRIPSYATIQEVLRRRRASAGDGEEKLQSLLGLTLTSADTHAADTFIDVITDTLGTNGLLKALAHPENLPTVDELAQPQLWQQRIDINPIPDDLSALFDSLGDAPVEPSATERLHGPKDNDTDV
jgi:putative hydrolase